MKKVAIFTTFFEADSGYSLISVVDTQINMLLDHGYDPIVLVQENFHSKRDLWQASNIDLRPVVPDLGADHNKILNAIKPTLDEIDVCITHDLVLQQVYKSHKLALQEYKRDDLLWLHWIHSCPSGTNSLPNGYIIYPNYYDKGKVCKHYELSGQEHRVIHNRASHAIDPLIKWNYDELTKDLIKAFNILDADISVVYPARLDRGKQPEKIIRLLAGVNNLGYKSKLLVIDWQSGGLHFQKYIDELSDLAGELSVDVAFTSRLHDSCNQGVPPHIVTELMDLSNVYIHPSRVETYSLVTHEAILRGKLVCLNFNFPPAFELFGDAGIYFDFGSDRDDRIYMPDEQTFWNDEAHRLVNEFKRNRVLVAQTKARREWTPNSMWKEFENLLYLDI